MKVALPFVLIAFILFSGCICTDTSPLDLSTIYSSPTSIPRLVIVVPSNSSMLETTTTSTSTTTTTSSSTTITTTMTTSSTSTTSGLRHQGSFSLHHPTTTSIVTTTTIGKIYDFYLSCANDSECVLAEGCCKCADGADYYAINKKYVDRWKQSNSCPFETICFNHNCRDIMKPCENYRSHCVNSICVVTIE